MSKKPIVHYLDPISTPTQWIALCRRLEIDGPALRSSLNFGYVAIQRERFTDISEKITCHYCIEIRTKKRKKENI